MTPWGTCRRVAIGLAASGAMTTAAIAGPPYETDDPEPTELGKWEIYLFSGGDGHGGNFDGAAGLDLNYGPVSNVQLTATLPIAISHDEQGWRAGRGNVEVGVKYRIFDDPDRGLSLAIFPRAILPTASDAGKTRLLLPIWGQKEFGRWKAFGGGGIELNPGSGNRDFWTGGLALTRQVAPGTSLGGEASFSTRQTIDGSRSASLAIGSVTHIKGPASLLLSAGPRFEGRLTSYRAYAALGLNF